MKDAGFQLENPHATYYFLVVLTNDGLRKPSGQFKWISVSPYSQGEVGAAGTVRLFEDKRLKTKFAGFPFVVWTEQMNCPEIRVQPAIATE